MGFWMPTNGLDQDEEGFLAQQEAFFRSQQEEIRRQAAQQMVSAGNRDTIIETAGVVHPRTSLGVHFDTDFHNLGVSQHGGAGVSGAVAHQHQAALDQDGPMTVADDSVSKLTSIPAGHPPTETNNHLAQPITGSLLGTRLADYDDEDAVVLVCGRCKATFHEARLFVHHKAQELCFNLDQNHQHQQPTADDRGYAQETVAYNQVHPVASIGEQQNRSILRKEFSDYVSGNNMRIGESTQAYTKLSTDFLGDEQEGDGSLESVTGIIPALNTQTATTAVATPVTETIGGCNSTGNSISSTYTRIPESSTRPPSTYEYWPCSTHNQSLRCTVMEDQGALQGQGMGPPPRIESGFTSDETNVEHHHAQQQQHRQQPSGPMLSNSPPNVRNNHNPHQLNMGQNDVTNKSSAETTNMMNPNGPWLTQAQQKSLQQAMSFAASEQMTPSRQQPHTNVASVTGADSDEWFTDQEREHIPSLLGLGEYIGPGSSWKTPVSLKPGVGIVLSGKFLPDGSSRYDKHFSFGLDLWDMTLPFSASDTRQRALYINPIFSTKEIQLGSMVDDTFLGVRHAAQDKRFPFRPGGKFTFAILCRDHGFKIWWKGTRGEGGTLYTYQYDVTKIKYLRVYDCHAIYIALGFRFS